MLRCNTLFAAALPRCSTARFQFLDGRCHGPVFRCLPPLSHALPQPSNPDPK
jgi:hypothetical protein